jgi:hypothetical protein
VRSVEQRLPDLGQAKTMLLSKIDKIPVSGQPDGLLCAEIDAMESVDAKTARHRSSAHF